MPVLSGEFSQGKPLVRVGLAPVLPQPGGVRPVADPQGFSMTGLTALLDTGADGTSITQSVARSHRLENMGRRSVVGAGGLNIHNTWVTFLAFIYDSDADFEGDNHRAENLFILPDAFMAVEIPDNRWFDVIIGRDILARFDFNVRRGGSWELHLE